MIVPLSQMPLAAAPDIGYAAIGLLILFVIFVATLIMCLTHWLPKAKRHGPEKDGTYESGMEVIGDARRRFNVRFYLVAMLFLLFDVDLVFMYPWAVAYLDADASGNAAMVGFLFWEMAIFFGLMVVGLGYDLAKGVLEFD